MHNIKETFHRADEMNHHPLHWEWSHFYYKNNPRRRFLWILYKLRNKFFPSHRLTKRRSDYYG